ncbi:MAG TPA: hypothetical protein VLY63_02300 [Anaerolineae bacterium]|nr:hypothetical protein [Anaerolineae bacterium]
MNDQGFDIVVVGNVGIDTAVYLPGADIDFDVESSFCENLDPGRAGKRLCCSGVCRGARKPAFIGYVDDDHNGRFMCETPARDGIDTSIRFVAPWGSSRSINFIYRHKWRRDLRDSKDTCTFNSTWNSANPYWPRKGLSTLAFPEASSASLITPEYLEQHYQMRRF